MTNTTLIVPEASTAHERVSEILSAAAAVLSGITLLLAVAVAF
jgi:hypothetical protein